MRQQGRWGWEGIFGTIGECDGGMNDYVSMLEVGCGPMNVSIKALSEGVVERGLRGLLKGLGVSHK